MKKKKNAFTLIELLAIIVILAIIAVITVPIILNIIENSRKGAATDSAYGYKDSVNKFYIAELQNHNKLKLDGTYIVNSDGSLEPTTDNTFGFGDSEYGNSLNVAVSGTIPSSGELTYENNVLKSGYLIIGDYTVTYSNGTFTAVKTSSISNESVEEPAQGGGEETQQSGSGSGQSDNYTYSTYGTMSKNPTFDYDDYQEPSNNNQCPEYYAYYEGDDENNAGCYPVYCDDGEYNYDTGKCEYIDYGDFTTLSNDWIVYLRKNNLTNVDDVCGVFGSGISDTVCLTSPYYNSNYSSEDGYESDFEDVTGETTYITTTSGLSATGLKGYALTKAQEMLSKGSSSCDVSDESLKCLFSSNNGYCLVNNNGEVECYNDGNHSYVYNDGGSNSVWE